MRFSFFLFFFIRSAQCSVLPHHRIMSHRIILPFNQIFCFKHTRAHKLIWALFLISGFAISDTPLHHQRPMSSTTKPKSMQQQAAAPPLSPPQPDDETRKKKKPEPRSRTAGADEHQMHELVGPIEPTTTPPIARRGLAPLAFTPSKVPTFELSSTVASRDKLGVAGSLGTSLHDLKAASFPLPSASGELKDVADGPHHDRSHHDSSVDEMKIQTMYKMVEDIVVTKDGGTSEIKFLYLTNKQASMFDQENISKCLQALELRDPKCVIRIMPSCKGRQEYLVHTESHDTSKEIWGGCQPLGCEITAEDEYVSASQLALFMEKCVLPLACQTSALIIVSGANDCTLAAALARAVAPMQARLGKKCPFTVLATLSLYEVYDRATNEPESISAQLTRGSPVWKRRLPFLRAFSDINKSFSSQKCSITSAASHVIMFESIDGSPENRIETCRKNSAPPKAFSVLLMSQLNRDLPSILIQSQHPDIGLKVLADHVQREIPVLLLDTRERLSDDGKGTAAKTELAKRAKTFPVFERKDVQEMCLMSPDGGELCVQSRIKIIELGLEALRRESSAFCDERVLNGYSASTLSFLHRLIALGQQPDEVDSSFTLAEGIAKIQAQSRRHRRHDGNDQSAFPSEVVMAAADFMVREKPLLDIRQQLSRIDAWMSLHDATHELYPKVLEVQSTLKDKEAKGLLGLEPSSRDAYLDFFHILGSPFTFSANVMDIDKCKDILNSVVRIDRLPKANSLSALYTLQVAWDNVEWYHMVADSYKRATKWSYFTLLFAGIAITVASLLSADDSRQRGANTDQSHANIFQAVILGSSLLTTCVSAYVGFINPAQKWQQLRGAALRIESEIWVFRTHSGAYRASQGSRDSNPDVLFSQAILAIQESVLDGADVKATAFFGAKTSLNKHGQHAKGAKGFGHLDHIAASSSTTQKCDERIPAWPTKIPSTPTRADDDVCYSFSMVEAEIQSTFQTSSQGADQKSSNDSHHSPLPPDLYVKFRIEQALLFYEGRIPLYSKVRSNGQAILILGSICSVVLVTFGRTTVWAAAVSIITSSVTAWLEFNGVSSKINRYSSAVHSLTTLALWWRTLDSIDKSLVGNIDKLVSEGEEIIKGETDAWASVASRTTSKMLNEAAQEKPKVA